MLKGRTVDLRALSEPDDHRVTLASGGPPMRVDHVHKENAVVSWWIENGMRRRTTVLPLVCLVPLLPCSTN